MHLEMLLASKDLETPGAFETLGARKISLTQRHAYESARLAGLNTRAPTSQRVRDSHPLRKLLGGGSCVICPSLR